MEVPLAEGSLPEVASEACSDQMEGVQRGDEVVEGDPASSQKAEAAA